MCDQESILCSVWKAAGDQSKCNYFILQSRLQSDVDGTLALSHPHVLNALILLFPHLAPPHPPACDLEMSRGALCWRMPQSETFLEDRGGAGAEGAQVWPMQEAGGAAFGV